MTDVIGANRCKMFSILVKPIKEKDIFITKGDANKTEDPVPAEASQIIGRVVFHLPYLGYVIHFLKARIPFAAVCIAACLSVLFDLAYTPKKKKIQGGI